MTISQMVDATLDAAGGNAADDPRAGRWSTARASRSSSSSSCAPRASCACASTARCTRSTRCRSSPRTPSTRSKSSSTGCACAQDLKQRLAESFETALRHGDGRAIAVEMDTGGEHLFSAKFACPICNYSLAELEPRLFSFNNPMGACPRCDGLGAISFFDPKRVVAFPQLSLASGAIKGWDRRNQFYFQMLQSLAKHFGFDLDKPFDKLPERVQQIILYGSGNEKIPFHVPVRARQADDARARVRGHHPEPRAPLSRDRFDDGARGAREIPELEALSRVRRHAAAARGAPRQGRPRAATRARSTRSQRPSAQGGRRVLPQAEARRTEARRSPTRSSRRSSAGCSS